MEQLVKAAAAVGGYGSLLPRAAATAVETHHLFTNLEPQGLLHVWQSSDQEEFGPGTRTTRVDYKTQSGEQELTILSNQQLAIHTNPRRNRLRGLTCTREMSSPIFGRTCLKVDASMLSEGYCVASVWVHTENRKGQPVENNSQRLLLGPSGEPLASIDERTHQRLSTPLSKDYEGAFTGHVEPAQRAELAVLLRALPAGRNRYGVVGPHQTTAHR